MSSDPKKFSVTSCQFNGNHISPKHLFYNYRMSTPSPIPTPTQQPTDKPWQTLALDISLIIITVLISGVFYSMFMPRYSSTPASPKVSLLQYFMTHTHHLQTLTLRPFHNSNNRQDKHYRPPKIRDSTRTVLRGKIRATVKEY